ncbi:hypothetical protein [Nocardioides sp. MH1]|uniref:hypothetical protein n=1 Tax=Nocardioides sp. MH1 TaxID=3242490 RepID=UPI0035218990
MSNQYPGPGQPGELPPTQVAPGGVPPQQPPAPQQPYGAPPQQSPYGAPQQPYGAPPPPPPGGGYGAPPTGGGGGKKVGLIIGLVVLLVLLIGGGAWAAVAAFGGDDSDDSPKKTVTITSTAPTAPSTDLSASTATSAPTEVTTPTEVTSSTAGGVPAADPQITARAYLDSLVTGDCLAVEGLSTPEWFSSEYGNQKGCKKASPNADMSAAEYEFQPAADNGDGSITLVAKVTAPGTDGFTATWSLVPNDDGSDWLVGFFLLA